MGLKMFDMQPKAPTLHDLDNWIKRLAKSNEFSMTIREQDNNPAPANQAKRQQGKNQKSNVPTFNAINLPSQAPEKVPEPKLVDIKLSVFRLRYKPTAQNKGVREIHGFVTVRTNRRSQESEQMSAVCDREES